MDKQIQIDKYNFYKNEFMDESVVFKLFEDLIYQSKDIIIECSHKIENKNINSNRVYIWFCDKTNHVRNINNTFIFFKNLVDQGASINYDLLKKFFNKEIDIKKIAQIAMGVDSRKDFNDSRIKLFFCFKDYPEKLKQILSLFKNKNEISNLLISKNITFMIGIDFYFDGRTKIKLYLMFNKESYSFLFNNKNLKLGKKANHLINECKNVEISLDNLNPKSKIIHFHPKHPSHFISLIKNNTLNDLNNKLKNKNHIINVISLNENEINASRIRNINVYY